MLFLLLFGRFFMENTYTLDIINNTNIEINIYENIFIHVNINYLHTCYF